MIVDAQGNPVSSTKDNPYAPTNVDQALDHVIEECGEVIAAYGKMKRFGVHSVNPELPESKQETNGDWLMRELGDLFRALIKLREFVSG